MNRRKPVRSHKFKSKWEFTRTNVGLIITTYVVIIVIILSARAKYNKQLIDFINKTDGPINHTSLAEKTSSCIQNGIDHCADMPNKMFVFHNKIPKSGSTTFYNIVAALAEQNDFDLVRGLEKSSKFSKIFLR